MLQWYQETKQFTKDLFLESDSFYNCIPDFSDERSN